MELFAHLQIAQAYEEFEAEDLGTRDDLSDYPYGELPGNPLPLIAHLSQGKLGILLALTAVWSTTLASTALAVEEYDPGFRPGASSTFVPVAPATTPTTITQTSSTTCASALCSAACGNNTAPGSSNVITSDNSALVRPTPGTSPNNTFVPVRPAVSGVFLRRGDFGPEVTRVQNLLRSAGYFDAASTGFYATLTEAGVKAFQRDRGLPVDGIVGDQTLTALQGFSPVRPTLLPDPVPQPGRNQLQIGDRSPEVARLQVALRNRGFYRGAIDGFYAAATEQAVIAYQRATGLPVSGIADSQTLAQLGVATDRVAAQ